MTEKLFSADERKQFEQIARRRGFKSLGSYVKTLINQDAEQHGETVEVEADDDLSDPVEGFKRGWAQAMRGEVLTEEEFWKAVTDDQ